MKKYIVKQLVGRPSLANHLIVKDGETGMFYPIRVNYSVRGEEMPFALEQVS